MCSAYYFMFYYCFFFFFKQKTAYEMRISDWSSDVCSSDLVRAQQARLAGDVGHHLALVPAMVAAGDDVGPGFEKLAADLVGDTEAGGRVLAVHDDEVEAEALAQPREMRRKIGRAHV